MHSSRQDRGETEDGKLAVWNSKKAFNEFWDLVQDEEKFLLMIEDATEDSSDE